MESSLRDEDITDQVQLTRTHPAADLIPLPPYRMINRPSLLSFGRSAGASIGVDDPDKIPVTCQLQRR